MSARAKRESAALQRYVDRVLLEMSSPKEKKKLIVNFILSLWQTWTTLVPRVFVPIDQRSETNDSGNIRFEVNLVPRASFPLTSGRKTRALGATISGMRHRCRCAVSRITRIRLFPLFFHNGCSQSSRFPTAGQGERSSGNEIDLKSENSGLPVELRMPKPEINMASSETCPRSLMEKDKV